MSLLNTSLFRVSSPLGVYCACEFDREPAIYYAGENVTGRIYFRTVHRSPISGIKARLVGCESVNFGQDYNAFAKAFLVLQTNTQLTFGRGEEENNYWYPFQFTLPAKMLPSFCGFYGTIRYYVEAVVSDRKVVPGQILEDMDLILVDEYGATLAIEPTLDLSLLPELSGPLFLVCDNSGGIRALFSRNKSPIRLTLTLHKKGYRILEQIHFTVDIHNGSTKPIAATSIKLIQEMRFSLATIKRSTTETVAKVVGSSIPPQTTTCWENTLRVPAGIPITLQSQHISVTYKLKVTLVTSVFMDNVKGDVGIVVGTIGLGDFDSFEGTDHQIRSNSFSSSRNSLSPRLHRHPHHQAPFRSTSVDHRRSISSLPSYTSVERDDGNAVDLPPPTYLEATQKDQ